MQRISEKIFINEICVKNVRSLMAIQILLQRILTYLFKDLNDIDLTIFYNCLICFTVNSYQYKSLDLRQRYVYNSQTIMG